MTDAAEAASAWPPAAEHVSVAEWARRQGVVPANALEDLVQEDFFESDEEHDEFLRDLYASRRAGAS